jgi:hypothetical protein
MLIFTIRKKKQLLQAASLLFLMPKIQNIILKNRITMLTKISQPFLFFEIFFERGGAAVIFFD